MKKFKQFISKHASVVASMALMFSVMVANSRCVCIYHQPKIPEGLQKLKK